MDRRRSGDQQAIVATTVSALKTSLRRLRLRRQRNCKKAVWASLRMTNADKNGGWIMCESLCFREEAIISQWSLWLFWKAVSLGKLGRRQGTEILVADHTFLYLLSPLNQEFLLNGEARLMTMEIWCANCQLSSASHIKTLPSAYSPNLKSKLTLI